MKHAAHQTIQIFNHTAASDLTTALYPDYCAAPFIFIPYIYKLFSTHKLKHVWGRHINSTYLMMPSSAALQKVLGHMGAVAIRLTRLVWSENMWMVSFAVKSCTWTLVSAAPVIKIRSSEWGRNCKHARSLRIHILAYLLDADWKSRNVTWTLPWLKRC